MSNLIKTGVSDYGMKPSTKPSGNVCTNGVKHPDLPTRTTGSDSILEVVLDENANLPKGTGK